MDANSVAGRSGHRYWTPTVTARSLPRTLNRANVALIYGPGNINVEYASSLVRGLERALFELGATVYTFNTALYKNCIVRFYNSGPRVGVDCFPENSELVKGIISFLHTGPSSGFDLVLGYFYDSYLLSNVMEALRRHARLLVNYPLNLLDQENHFSRALEFFDETWCSEEGALDRLRTKYGQRVRYVPMASDPFIFRPVGVPERPALLFVGSSYGRRMELLAICARQMPITVAGTGHNLAGALRAIARRLIRDRTLIPPMQIARMLSDSVRNRRPIGDEEFVQLAARHGVSIGFADVREELTRNTVFKVRLREYECAMTGLCHIARRLPELERHFETGREILLYDDPEEIPSILRRISRGELDWIAIGQRARQRAEREHTWRARFAPIFS